MNYLQCLNLYETKCKTCKHFRNMIEDEYSYEEPYCLKARLYFGEEDPKEKEDFRYWFSIIWNDYCKGGRLWKKR